MIATLAWQFTHEAVRFSQGDAKLNPGTMISDEAAGLNGPSEPAPAHTAKKHLSASIASMEMLSQGEALNADTVAEQAWAVVQAQGEVNSELAASELSDGSQILRVMTSADTWVEIFDADGMQVEMDLIRADESRDYTGKAPFSILVGRASAVRIQLDGQSVDLAPHTRGNVARMNLGGQMTVAAEQPTDAIQR